LLVGCSPADGPGPWLDDDTEGGEPGVPAEQVPGSDGEPEAAVFDPEVVHEIQVDLDETAIQSLRTTPEVWVEGAVTFDGIERAPVGIRLKGSASFQSVDHKPAWKFKFDHVHESIRLYGLERLTLNNEVWDPTMMAEAMAYEAFRDNGSAAPRTGYAAVTLNERYLGLYAIIESMDDAFVDHQWPGSDGGLWEMTRDCDFTGDCTCFELQETGDAYEADALVQGCEAVTLGTAEAVGAAFDWEALIAFLAVERAVNHPDSYSFNLNNFFVYHDPLTDRLFLSPWGADSTFVYAYPPSAPNPGCDPLYRDVDTGSPVGWLAGFCLADPTCRADLDVAVLDVASWMEDTDLVGRMEQRRDALDPWAALETEVNWTDEDRDARVACFLEWTAQRPDELRAWVGP
jgi:hypothetical protein